MQKRFRLIFLILSLLIAMIACEKKTDDVPMIFFTTASESAVGVKIDSYETKGTLCIDQEGSIRFTHENPNSPLFGLVEQYENGLTKCEFGGIQWESEESNTALSSFFRSLIQMKDTMPIDKTQTSIQGIAVIQYAYENENSSFWLSYDKKNRTPVKFYGIVNSIEIEISFL